MQSYADEFSHKIIIGDFNTDLIRPDDETRALLNFIDKHSLKVVKHGATHQTRTAAASSDTHIDLILTDSHDTILNFNKFPSPYVKNGHDIITASNELIVVKPSEASFSFHDYKDVRTKASKTALSSVIELVFIRKGLTNKRDWNASVLTYY